MRRDTTQDTTRWSAKLPLDDYERFQELLPINGALTAVVILGLRRFIERLEDDPLLQAVTHERIAHHLYEEERLGKMHALDVRIPTELYVRFNAMIPEWGGATWFIRALIGSLNRTLQQNIVGTQIDTAVERLLEPVPSTVEE